MVEACLRPCRSSESSQHAFVFYQDWRMTVFQAAEQDRGRRETLDSIFVPVNELTILTTNPSLNWLAIQV
jgi:hypothetical protein